jgi:hypothetical protein
MTLTISSWKASRSSVLLEASALGVGSLLRKRAPAITLQKRLPIKPAKREIT